MAGKGQGFKSPQLHHHLPAETARLATQQPGQPQETPGGITVRQACYQAIRDRRHLARDLRRATPAAGHVPEPFPTRFERHRPLDRRYGPRADYPVAGAWAARACGIAVTWVGRPAPLFTLVVAWPGAARGYGALVTALLWSCSGSCSSSSWVSHGRAPPGSALEVTLMTLPWWGDRRWRSRGTGSWSRPPPRLADRPCSSQAGRAERFPCAYVDRWHP